MDVKLHLPSSIQITPSLFAQMKQKNKEVKLRIDQNILTVEELNLKFSDLDFLELHFPFHLTYHQFEDLSGYNADWHKIEYHSDKIQINMAITGLIGAFSALVLVALAMWNKTKKFGKIYNDPTAYELVDSEGRKMHKIPDISLVAFHKSVQSLYNEKGFIQAAPTLVIEIVSHKYSLQQDLNKMAEHWMPNNTQIGIVVDPHKQMYHVFNQNTESYTSFQFSVPFTHTLLPDLSISFMDILLEAQAEL